MKSAVKFHDDFEFEELDSEVQEELLAHTVLLEKFGPRLGRPYADTLKGSKFNNMKELRFNAENGVWRVIFAFDPRREAILLAIGNKSGVSEKNFYKKLIKKGDERYLNHLRTIKGN